ncbi:disease resistance protein RPS2 [Canna indica]|uniref:Disease resistance protein RPS2 n=1 Tax=Canna indica TaxID=4628 RepID=A0AAQ3KIC1_9LILI|nr:disease resistance protein RPS2 [Canna indica]
MESVLSILDSIFGPILAFFTRTFGYAVSCEQYIDLLHKEMGELRSKRDDVKREVDREARQGLEATNEVMLWLRNVERLEREAARISEEFAARYADPADAGATSKLVLGYHLSKRADGARGEASSLMAKSNFYKVADQLMPVRFEARPSALTVGMGSVLERLRSAYADEDVGVIGVHGMGGVGKTALLNRFNNEVIVEETHLGVVISIRVTRDFDVEKTQRAIGDRLGLSWDERKSEDERAMVLFKVLSKMRFVLLLDDLWAPLDLAMVGIPTPTGGSKIIFTTRIEDVCDRMDAKKMRVKCLEWENAWELFKRKAGERLLLADHDIRRHAEDLARRCGGLPLALITVGRAMASKRTAKEWRHAVTTLSNAPWQLLGMEENVLHLLKQSYDKLDDDRLKTFLLYSSLHMDMHPMHKATLIDLCIGEGVIDDFDDPEDAYSEGYHLLGVLKAASLLQYSGEDHVKMHPLIRAMVSWLVCECGRKDGKWLVQAGAGLPEAPDAEKWKGAERISFVSNDITSLPEEPHCPALLTLLLGGNRKLSKIPGGFFRSMPCLKVLDLSRTSIKELPPEIGTLLQLQYIDLYETSIASLPKELGNLVKLRSLLLSSTPLLKTIPHGVIASLAELRVLCMYASYGSWRMSSSGAGINFEELEGLKRLRYLDITLENASTLQRLSRARRLAISTRYLHIRGCLGLTTIQLPSASLGRCMRGLRCLRISHSSKLEEIAVGGGSGVGEWGLLPNMHFLMLQQLLKAKIIFKDRNFPNLRFLHVWNCSGMEQLIKFEDELSEGQEAEVVFAFPHLKELHLVGLPELKSLGEERRVLGFPRLRVLEVNECPKLKELSMVGEELTEIQCSQEWWDGLEWKDDNIKEALMPLFPPSLQ